MKNIPYFLLVVYVSVNWPSLVQMMACRLYGVKPLSEPMLEYYYLEQNSS